MHLLVDRQKQENDVMLHLIGFSKAKCNSIDKQKAQFSQTETKANLMKIYRWRTAPIRSQSSLVPPQSGH